MLATVPSAVVQGVDGLPITIEVHVSNGLPGYTIVGSPDASCRESRDRVRAAVLSSGFTWPARRVTINLAPGGLRKQGASLDLPIALGVLAASGQIDGVDLSRLGAIGELGLDGTIRPVAGLVCLAGAIEAEEILVPAVGADEAAVVRPGRVRAVASLRELLLGLKRAEPMPPLITPDSGSEPGDDEAPVADLADVRGQPLARWALEVAAAGGHHLLMIGPPGAGKTMLATRLVGLLPPLGPDDALAVTRVHSAAGLRIPPGGLVRRVPLRAPHHGASAAALIGGGTSALRPGEISCANLGVLFLDELGEFPPAVLDALRQPLEEGVVRVSRAARAVTMPARFLLVAAMNPCPCGEGGAEGQCRCTDRARARYARRLSGPLLDRFDLRVEVRPPGAATLLDHRAEESTAAVAERVARVRGLARSRGMRCNADLPPDRLDEIAPLATEAIELLRIELETGGLTGRGLRRVRTMARTIADLQQADGPIGAEIIEMALALRATPKVVLGEAA